MTYVLARAKQPMAPMLMIEVIDQWIRRRQLPARCGKFSITEKMALQAWTQMLRHTLEQFFSVYTTRIFCTFDNLSTGAFDRPLANSIF